LRCTAGASRPAHSRTEASPFARVSHWPKGAWGETTAWPDRST
jgi:hypothetical protein